MPFLDPPETVAVYSRLQVRPNTGIAVGVAAALFFGCLQIAGAMGWLPVPPPREGRGILLLVGLVFVGGGLLMLSQAVEAILGRRRLALEGWLGDYPWDARGAADDTRREVRGAPFTLAVMGGLLAAATLGFWSTGMPPDLRWLPFAFLLPLHAAFLYGVYRYVSRLWQWRRFAFPRLRFVTPPPFLPGSRVEIRLEGSAALTGALTAELRCVEETLLGTVSSSRGARQYKSLATFRASWPVLVDSQGQGTFRFTVPDEAEPTQLREDRYPPLRYWELVISGNGYEGIFLLPVYH